MDRLANGYAGIGEYAKAEPLYQRALAIREKALGPEHPDVATTLEGYALLLRKTHRDGERAELETRAKAIREQAEQNQRPQPENEPTQEPATENYGTEN